MEHLLTFNIFVSPDGVNVEVEQPDEQTEIEQSDIDTRPNAKQQDIEIVKDQEDQDQEQDQISGGLADNAPDEEFCPRQLAVGQKVEMEHTDDPNLAKEIAKDHLKEHPRYYRYLKRMEDMLKQLEG